jgi:hypothetical protein
MASKGVARQSRVYLQNGIRGVREGIISRYKSPKSGVISTDYKFKVNLVFTSE